MQGVSSVQRLKAIWKLLKQLEGEWEANWDHVEQWRLFPLEGKALLKIAHRTTVFAPPPRPEMRSDQAGVHSSSTPNPLGQHFFSSKFKRC